MKPTITLSWPESQVALLTLDAPDSKANILSSHVLDELEKLLDEIQQQEQTRGVAIISAKPGMFIAGADLREFAKMLDADDQQIQATCRRGQSLFRRFSQLPGVSVAAIDGICVGGGAELAIWCDRRILTTGDRTEYGFPEVKLGLYPGWGGTVRLPRIAGLANAVEMITGGESVDGREALEMGLADDLVDPQDLQEAAVRMIQAEAERQEYKRDREHWSHPCNLSPTELGFLGATASAMILGQTKGHYPAPMAALELMLESSAAPVDKALEMEAENFSELFGSDVNRALLNVFFLTDRNKKDEGVDNPDAKAADLQSVGVIGAGIMGGGIAAANIKRGVPTVLNDASPEALQKGGAKVLEEASYNRKTKRPDASTAIQLSSLLHLGDDHSIASCDLVVEAIVENLEAKRKLLQHLEPQLKSSAVLGSNTSTIPITALAEGLERPDQFCGVHFFNPVRRMKLVEVIRGEQTSDDTVATAVRYAKRVGKMPIVVNDGPGFLVNRLLFPYMNEALRMLIEGVPIADIDKAAVRFGMPMGPIALYDMVGLDTALFAGRVMWEAFPDRIDALPILPALVKQGRLGQKSGKGFFNYENRKRRAEPDPWIDEFLSQYVRGEPAELDRETITWRLFAPMLLEATRVLDAKMVRDVRDVDLGLIFALGFPPFRGGLLFWADTMGPREIVERLKPLEQLGPRFEPTALLKEMAHTGATFYHN